MNISVTSFSSYLPTEKLSNEDLARVYEDWEPEKIEKKTGIRSRQISQDHEFSSDLAIKAAQNLISSQNIETDSIDALVLCTQTPDYLLPTTACIVHGALGLRANVGAFDINLGCSGFIYSLGVVKGLIASGQAEKVLLITVDTYSKLIASADRSVRTIFGDAACASIVEEKEKGGVLCGPFVYGTDGSGGKNLWSGIGGMRPARGEKAVLEFREALGHENWKQLHMNGPEIFNFTLQAVPDLVHDLLSKSGQTVEDIDCFIFHQANAFMLNHLRKRLKIRKEKFWVGLRDCGNTVSSSIPIALEQMKKEGLLDSPKRLALVGFGVGYSWGATIVDWKV